LGSETNKINQDGFNNGLTITLTMVKLFVTLFARPTLLSYSKYFTEDTDFLWATGKLSNGRSEIQQ